MQKALNDKTNERVRGMKKTTRQSDKEGVVMYLKEVTNRTTDNNLKYDLYKCVEILEGKENQEYIDLKEALEEILIEKELLFKEKCELAVELDYLKSKENK